eukprot:TRINITY_DN111_c0_g1_i1.p1 TRINITY_DN111_c0_g1~~TRINITY_DN111_c0_g1_i1.p1  ORF type:complete len:243 (+),score=52.41 TRINITY_DN111_c0_g1_i1:54-782(+)
MSDACCTLAPVSSSYTAVGKIETINGMSVYVTGPKDSKFVHIGLVDIFGVLANAKQFADKLSSSTGQRVILPDYYLGAPWSQDNFPPKGGRDELVSWIQKVATLEVVDKHLNDAIEHAKKDGATHFTIFGFCYGAKLALQKAAKDANFYAVGLLHPSFVDASDIKELKSPVICLPSKDEPDMLPFMESLKKVSGDKHYHQRFDDMQHGWCAARGDWSVPEQAKRATEAIELLANFFKKNAPK